MRSVLLLQHPCAECRGHDPSRPFSWNISLFGGSAVVACQSGTIILVTEDRRCVMCDPGGESVRKKDIKRVGLCEGLNAMPVHMG